MGCNASVPGLCILFTFKEILHSAKTFALDLGTIPST